MILSYSITVFITQLIFIGCRTWNVRAIAKDNLLHVLMSGALVHLTWLLSIGIGAFSIQEFIKDFDIKYLPIIACSLCGGLIGSWIGLKAKRNK